VSVGRPPKYKKEYCQMLIDHMATGMSFESFAAEIETHRGTLYNWKKQYPEFLNAHKIGIDKMTKFFEKIGLMGMAGKIPGFNPTVYVWTTKNKLRWTDRVETDVNILPKPAIIERLDGSEIELGTIDVRGDETPLLKESED